MVHFEVFETVSNLLACCTGDVLIDMPIGLPDGQRGIEASLRPLLGRRASSLFAIPCRDAVFATDYRSACDINETVTGRRFAIQSWHICRKIAELDHAMNPALQARVHECHPEIAFAGVAGSPIADKKRTAKGRSVRLALLAPLLPGLADAMDRAAHRYRRSEVALDDCLDAAVLLAVAETGYQLFSLGETDRRGLKVEMALPIGLVPPAGLSGR